MIKKGIILAGGNGTRVGPVTKSVSKQLIPLFDKPIIFYSLSILMLMNIKKILIITRPEDVQLYKKILNDGSDFGIEIKYEIQSSPRGLPDAFILGESFIKNKNVALILGDNFFHGQSLTEILKLEIKKFNSGAQIFTYSVKNPQDYGVVEYQKNNKFYLVEKPKKPKSNNAITGLYFFDKNVSNYSKILKKSKRNELEIVDLLNQYLKNKKLKIYSLGRGSSWLDTGNCEDILKASNYINILENRQNLKIGCIEEIAYKKKFISKFQLKKRIKFYGKCSYSDYLSKLI
jgi:glucose-1-phosphate thymidylyltransferase